VVLINAVFVYLQVSNIDTDIAGTS